MSLAFLFLWKGKNMDLPFLSFFSERETNKAGHEPARARLGASHTLARWFLARLGLARLADEPEK
jgi:hypothetical protein